jgi:phosphoribosylformylglycinamidine synthase
MFKARVEVTLKKGISDPEGKNILKALHLLGFEKVTDIKVAKVMEIYLGYEEKEVRAKVEDMCNRLLANPVIHDYKISVERT